MIDCAEAQWHRILNGGTSLMVPVTFHLFFETNSQYVNNTRTTHHSIFNIQIICLNLHNLRVYRSVQIDYPTETLNKNS